jgi:putative transposase
MNEWYSAKEAAGLPLLPNTDNGVLRRARRAKKEGTPWQERTRKGQGGGAEYHYSSFPKETQNFLLAKDKKEREYAEAQARMDADLALVAAIMPRQAKIDLSLLPELSKTQTKILKTKEEYLALFRALPKEHQDAAWARYEVLVSCQKYMAAEGFTGRMINNRRSWSTKGVVSFVAQITCHVIKLTPAAMAEITRKGEISLSYSSLIRWRDQFHDQGVYGLADHYVTSSTEQAPDNDPTWAGKTSIPRPQRQHILALFIARPYSSYVAIIDALEARFPKIPAPSRGCIASWWRRWIARHASLWLLATNPDEWKNKHMLAFGNASEDIIALNQVWEMDSTPGDVICTDGRYTIIGCIQVWSRRMRFLVSDTSKSSAVAALLRKCLILWGFPDTVKTDNGADYTAIFLEIVLDNLEINHVLCPPFTPECKPHIERGLGVMSHNLLELIPGYCGHNVADRQAIRARETFAKRLMSPGEEIEAKMTSVELQQRLDRWCDLMYEQNVHGGLDGMTPHQKARSWTEPIKTISNIAALDLLLQPAPDGEGYRTITKTGISVTYKGAKLSYIAVEFAEHVGEKVRPLLDESDLGRCRCFLEDGTYLCDAEDPTWTGISRQEVAAHAKARQKKHLADASKELKKLVKNQNVEHVVDEIMLARENRLREESDNVIELPVRTVEYTTPALDQAARALRAPQVDPDQEALDQERAERIERQMRKLQEQAEANRETDAASGPSRQPRPKIVPLFKARTIPEFPQQKWELWQALDAEIAAGKVPESEGLVGFYLGFPRSAACRTVKRCFGVEVIEARELAGLDQSAI